jgi:glucokinase
MQILAGDIGGTHCRLALYQADSPSDFTLSDEMTFASAAAANPVEIITQFLSRFPERAPDMACIGIAGPVIEQTCATTNLPWRVSAQEIRDTFGLERVWLLNDLEASAWGIDALEPSDFHLLNPGHAQINGNRAIIAAGTGLGEAGMVWNGSRHQPFATEGSHSDFAPINTLEFALHQWLAARHGHVSWERLVSGPGLEAIYCFLLEHHHQRTPDWLHEAIARQGLAPAVSSAALEERDALCIESLDLFLDLFGREAGNLALKLMATGGVYLGGGIAPRILAGLKSDRFRKAFCDKGRMSPLLEAMPVWVILADKIALSGAVRYAMLQA